MIRIWCDGSSSGGQRGKPIGYAAVIDFGDDFQLEMAAWCHDGTNNTAELKAAIMGLWAVRPEACLKHGVQVITDSEYVMNQALGNHGTKKNHELVTLLRNETQMRQVRWDHVRGHTGDPGNERADTLARQARLKWPTSLSCLEDQVLVTCTLLPKAGGPPILSLDGPYVNQIWDGERWLQLVLRT